MESLTGAYYGAELRIERFHEDEVQISRPAFNRISDALNTPEPVLVKLEEMYFPAYRGEQLPHRTMAVPTDDLRSLRSSSGETGYIWIPKNQRQMKQYYGK